MANEAERKQVLGESFDLGVTQSKSSPVDMMRWTAPAVAIGGAVALSAAAVLTKKPVVKILAGASAVVGLTLGAGGIFEAKSNQ